MQSRAKKGVEEASSMSPNSHSNKLVYVRYRDHIEFRNTSHKLYFDVNVREAVGWLIFESNEFLCITYDRSVQPLPNEGCESGFSIIKSDILELREIK